jgi:acetylornithine deacetylase/succinyl-diaminopimelate desuccinylase-like protein
VLDATPAPREHERAAAYALCSFARSRWPSIAWHVQEIGTDGGNLIASHGPGPLLYSHLDTSLDGGPADVHVTGRADPVGGLSVSDRTVIGFGLGVARAPAAAALVGFASASAGTVLLAGSGTHRRSSQATGLTAYLAENRLPPSAIVAKSGPPTLLWAEPGALYLTVTVRGRQGVAMAPETAAPTGGVAAQAGVVLAALDAWRRNFLATCPPGETGRAVGIGAVRSGWPDKPDLLPAAIEIGLYVVIAAGDDAAAVAADVDAQVRQDLSASALRDCTVSVEPELIHPAARTSPDAPIVRAASQAWTAEFGAPPARVSGWTGATDAIVLRGRGVDTVRLGPTVAPSAEDPRRDRVELDVLESFARIYRCLLAS